ncbi:MAG: hypothetical protein ACRCST_07775 [Turicibacter sp.]
MRYKLVDPSYCATVDLTYHKHAIREGIKTLKPDAIIQINRYDFEIENADLQTLNLTQLSTEISNRDSYLNSLYATYYLKKESGEVLLQPLLFKPIMN